MKANRVATTARIRQDKWAHARDKPANEREAAPCRVESQVTTNWKRALAQLAVAYSGRIESHL